MARGRKPQLRVGDPVSNANDKNKTGVIVHISTEPTSLGVILERPYEVHWYPHGRGAYAKDELLKIKPSVKEE